MTWISQPGPSPVTGQLLPSSPRATKLYSLITTFREIHKYPWALCLPAVSLEKLPKSVRLTGNPWDLTGLGERMLSTRGATGYLGEPMVSTRGTTDYFGERMLSTRGATGYLGEPMVSTRGTTDYFGERMLSTRGATGYLGESTLSTRGATDYLGEPMLSTRGTTGYLGEPRLSTRGTTDYLAYAIHQRHHWLFRWAHVIHQRRHQLFRWAYAINQRHHWILIIGSIQPMHCRHITHCCWCTSDQCDLL